MKRGDGAMKIGFIGLRGVPATYGGIERHVEEIGARLVERGHEVTVFCRSGYAEEDLPSHRGITLVHHKAVASKHFEALSHSMRASVATIGKGFDIVHFHAIGPGICAAVPRMATRAKVVQTIHGLDHERAKWGALAGTLMRSAAWSSGHVPHETMVVSHELVEHYARTYGRIATYVTNGVTAPNQRAASAITERWGLTAGSFVMFMGRLVPEKAPDALIRAFAKVPGDVRLVIVGGSSHTDDYVAQLEELAARDERVLLTGYVYGDEKDELLSNAAAFVNPSLLEGLPLTVLEACSYARPVVASSIAPHVEVLGSDGPGHRLVPPGDEEALAAAIADELASLDVAAKGAQVTRDRVLEEYSWDRATDITEATYRRALGR